MASDLASAPLCAAPQSQVSAPDFKLPSGACDCHAHVFLQQGLSPLIDGRTYTPPDASLDDYKRLLHTLGFDRAVIVQPSIYGVNNLTSLQAVADTELEMRAVVVIDETTSCIDLQKLHDQGARGVRINMLFNNNAQLQQLQQLTGLMAEMGWHLQCLADVSSFSGLYDWVKQQPVPVVFDHMGHVQTEKGVKDAGFQQLLRLLAEGDAWVKLSGAYRVTSLQATPFDDVNPFAEALIKANAEQLVWGSDWPHPHIPVPMPNDTDLLNQFGTWVTDAQLREQILVANPARLYDF